MGASVFIIEPAFLVRKGYEHMIGAVDEIECVGMAARPEEALETIPELSPDLVITEIVFEADRKLDVDIIRRLKRLPRAYPVLVVSVLENTYAVTQALDAGADGYLIKWEAGDQLFEAISTVEAGGLALSPQLNRPEIRAHFQ